MFRKKTKWLVGTSIGLMAASGSVLAQEAWSSADWSFSGLLREEVAYKLGSDQNINNYAGNPFNGVSEPNAGLAGAVPGLTTLTRPASQKNDTNFNMLATRIELNADGKFNDNWAAHFKIRGYTEQVKAVENAYQGYGMIKQTYGNHGSGGAMGSAGKNSIVDLPVAYLDYSKGPLWVRVGNQQIAWGEALFFRVADTANGLDYRRHLLLDVAAEEFSDKRVSALGIRSTFRATDNVTLEGFAQQFQPSVIPTPNSPYNVVPAQFYVDEKTGYDDAKKNFNLGLRFQGNFDDIGVQAFAVRRNNPDGVYKWTQGTAAGSIPGNPFTFGTGNGVYSAQEWFSYASSVRLDGLGGLEASLNEFTATQPGGFLAPTLAVVAGACGAPNANPGSIKVNTASATCILDTFFTPPAGGGFGNLVGNIARVYPRENVFGFGLNTVFSGAPDSWTDQLIGRFELSYTPNKKFTNPTLSQTFLEKDETVFAFITEKYHKFSDSMPATYMVLQWMHKTESDIFGRSVSGQNQVPGTAPKGEKNGYNNIAFVVQQPSPTLEYRFDLAALTDLRGGYLLQPGVKWKLNKSMQLDVYANYIGASNNYNDFGQGLQYAREVFIRASYYF